MGGDGRQRWQWEESKDLGSLWAGSELLRMVGLEISSQGASPLGLAAGAVLHAEERDSRGLLARADAKSGVLRTGLGVVRMEKQLMGFRG